MYDNFSHNELIEIFSTLPDPLFILTEDGYYKTIFGGEDTEFYHDGKALIGKTLYDVLPEEKADWFVNQIQEVLKNKKVFIVEYGLSGNDVDGLDTNNGPKGEIWFEGRMKALPFLVDGKRAVVWMARNITQSHELKRELHIKSETDVLTGALNRRRFMLEIEMLFNDFRLETKPSSLLMIDIDYFKQINDTYGHITGDEILKQIVNVCKSQLRKDDMFFRYGGEEFVALLPNTNQDEAIAIAERIRHFVEKEHFKEDIKDITVSIGIDKFKISDKDFNDMIKRADKALYIAKGEGRNLIKTL